MRTFFFVVGWPLRVFIASLLFVVGNCINPDDKNIKQMALDVYHGKP